MAKKFYFTFGTSEKFPFQRGWVEVYAETKRQAAEIFNRHYPPRHGDTVNCAFIYDQAYFENTEMFLDATWGGCHRVLNAE
jgi:hypothetical protein